MATVIILARENSGRKRVVRGSSFLTTVLRKSQQDLWVNLVDGLKEKEGLRMTAKFLS